MSDRGVLIVHNDQNFVQIVTQIANENACQAHVALDGIAFAGDYKRIRPTVIVYEFFTEGFDGIELTQWLIGNANTARVILTASHSLELTRAATALAKSADLFPLSVLLFPASRDEFLVALEG